MIEQKKFYSIAYGEQNIHETHKSILNKKTTAKSPDKKKGGGGGGGGGLRKSTKLLYLISAIFRVRPHVFINITSDVIQGDAPGIKPPGMSDPPLAIINCDVPAASIHGFKEGHLVMWLMVINLPPPCRKELLYGVEERWIGCKEETWVDFKPCCFCLRMMESHIVPGNYKGPHVFTLLILLWNQALVEIIEKGKEALGIIGSNLTSVNEVCLHLQLLHTW